MLSTSNINLCAILLAMVVLCPGCGNKGDRPDLGTVHGTVTLDGKPFGGVVVVFSPEKGRPSTGLTDVEGRYELLYLHDYKGAKTGPHSVGFRAKEDVTPAFSIPRKYSLGGSSPLQVEVKEGTNELNFDLESK